MITVAEDIIMAVLIEKNASLTAEIIDAGIAGDKKKIEEIEIKVHFLNEIIAEIKSKLEKGKLNYNNKVH